MKMTPCQAWRAIKSALLGGIIVFKSLAAFSQASICFYENLDMLCLPDRCCPPGRGGDEAKGRGQGANLLNSIRANCRGIGVPELFGNASVAGFRALHEPLGAR
jgi:hypothetical protein